MHLHALLDKLHPFVYQVVRQGNNYQLPSDFLMAHMLEIDAWEMLLYLNENIPCEFSFLHFSSETFQNWGKKCFILVI